MDGNWKLQNYGNCTSVFYKQVKSDIRNQLDLEIEQSTS